MTSSRMRCGYCESCTERNNGPRRSSHRRIFVGRRNHEACRRRHLQSPHHFQRDDPRVRQGTTTKVMITSAELQSPIEISDPDVLKNFNVWSGPGTFSNDVEGNEGFIVDWASGVVTERP